MAEGTRLLSEYGVTSPIEGSNPSLSVLQIAALEIRDRAKGDRESVAVIVQISGGAPDQLRASIVGNALAI